MPKFRIKFNAGALGDTSLGDEVVEAEYFKHEDDWTTFKDVDHKVLCDIPSHGIRMISKLPDEAAV